MLRADAEKRQLELYLLRFLPHALRDDFVTVGLLLVESDGGFAEDAVYTRHEELQCVAPEVEWEWFGMVEQEIRGRLGSLRRREELLQLVNEKFGTMLDVGPTKAVITQDPEEEMEALTSMYLVSTARVNELSSDGADGDRHSMIEAFANAGVLELMQRDLDVMQYTGLGDPFRIDFGIDPGAR